MVRGRAPRLDLERELVTAHGLVAAMDEVGRGALAGPVTVGVVVLDAAVLDVRPPRGLRDSKLLTPAQRGALEDRIARWVRAHAVACASAQEIDAIGIIAALRRAGERALAALPTPVDLVLLDGSHDWLTRRPVVQGLFDLEPEGVEAMPRARREDPDPGHDLRVAAGPRVCTRVKADLTCAGVAAASVLAKLHRDELMVRLHQDHPAFAWAENKGYAAPTHRAALLAAGPTPWHRQSWSLGLTSDDDAVPTTHT